MSASPWLLDQQAPATDEDLAADVVGLRNAEHAGDAPFPTSPAPNRGARIALIGEYEVNARFRQHLAVALRHSAIRHDGIDLA